MSTTAEIQVKGSEVKIYKHHDGYPEEVLPILQDFLGQFIKERGNEPDYGIAQIMRAFARKDLMDSNQDDIKMTGWGLHHKHYHGVNFIYKVDLEKREIIVKDQDLGSTELIPIYLGGN